MSLVLLESWDNYRQTSYIESDPNWNAVAYGKWTSQSGGAIYAGNGGRHGYRVQRNGDGTSYLEKRFQSDQEHGTITFGSAFEWVRSSSNVNQVIPLFGLGSDFGGTPHFGISLYTGNLAGSTSGLIIENAWPVGNGTNATTILPGILTPTTGALGPSLGYRYLEVKVVFGDATNGRVTIRVGGGVVYDQAFQTFFGGTKTVYDTFRMYFHMANGQATYTLWDDTYLTNGAGTANTGFMGDIIVNQHFPNAAGTVNQFANSGGGLQINNYQYLRSIDSTGQNDYVYSSTDDQSDLYGYDDSGYAAPSTISGVMLYTRADKADTGPRSMAHLARVSGTTTASADIPLSSDRRFWNKAYDTAPDGSAWDFTKFNAAEFGFRVRP